VVALLTPPQSRALDKTKKNWLFPAWRQSAYGIFTVIEMKTTIFGVGEIQAGFLTLGSATNNEGAALRFRAVGVASELNGRVKFYAHLQELDGIGVVACMVTCERSALPQKVWVSAQVEEGRITGLGRTHLQASEIMGILGGVLNELVLFIDPTLPPVKAALKSAGKKKKASPEASGPVKKEAENNSEPVDTAPAAVPQTPAVDLTAPPAVIGEPVKEGVTRNGEIRSLHDRVEVLNPQALDSFPCTSSHIPILDDRSGNKAPAAPKGRKRKQEPGSEQEKSNGENAVHAAAGQDNENGQDGNGLSDHAGTNGSVLIDPNLMLKGENGEDISDSDLLF
jgi:hypothetical protein